jgi:predicted Zn-dependent protease
VGTDALFAKYSRHDELQADSEAVVNVTRAGYEPKGVTDLFEVLLRERKYQPTEVEGWFASHPLEETRIRQADAWIAQVPRDPSKPLIVDSPDFEAFKARVLALPPPPPPPKDANQR